MQHGERGMAQHRAAGTIELRRRDADLGRELTQRGLLAEALVDQRAQPLHVADGAVADTHPFGERGRQRAAQRHEQLRHRGIDGGRAPGRVLRMFGGQGRHRLQHAAPVRRRDLLAARLQHGVAQAVLVGEQLADVRLEDREHGAAHVAGPAKAMDGQRGDRDDARAAQPVLLAVQDDLGGAALDVEDLEQRLVAMRPDLPRVQAAALGDRLRVHHVGRRQPGVLGVEQVGWQVLGHGSRVRICKSSLCQPGKLAFGLPRNVPIVQSFARSVH